MRKFFSFFLSLILIAHSPLLSFYDEDEILQYLEPYLDDPSILLCKNIAPLSDTKPYERHPNFPEEIWNGISPLFLPEDSPMRVVLDKIFSKRRVLGSLKEMSRAGFIIKTDPKNKIIVARHPKIKGYLFKVYLDTSDSCDHYWWKKRVIGARTIQEAIDRYGYGIWMKTPQKWIYPLPIEPAAAEGTYEKHFILVVEDMHILDHENNRIAYKKFMTKEKLLAFYHLLTELKLIDSVYADNTPFCKDGKMAFLDTEHAMDETFPVPITSVGQYLNPEMLAFWEQVIVHHGFR